MKRNLLLAALMALVAILITTACGGGGGGSTTSRPSTVNVSISDPPTCAGPSGPFSHVYVTIKDVKIHQSASANANDAGWIDLTPSLSSAPKQVDLLGIANNTCFLAMLGSNTEIQPGSYQQIRIFLAPDSAAGSIAGNACGNNANCVVTSADSVVHPMDLSSEVQTGIKIPSGQLAGGAFAVAAGTQKDLNIDFDACASIIAQNNGRYRLKPVMHAGEVSLTATSVSGKLVDKATNAPIVGGKGIVALETRDVSGVNRVVMQTTPDANGNFVLCPVPAGTFDVVAVAVNGNGVAYAATVVTGVQAGNNVGTLPMIAQTGTNTSPASITGQVTTTKGTATAADITLAALQSFTDAGATVNIVVPLAQQSSATATVATAAGGSCAANTACADYTLSVPAMQPNVAAFATSGMTFTQATTTPVAYTVDALAFVQGSGGTPDCTPSEVKVSTVTGGGALTVTPGATANATIAAFTSCQ